MRYIHLNCDLGEGSASDFELMPLISACNIACGGHAGNLDSMRRSIRLALDNNVEIGAHPSYPDKKNFGRKSVKMPDMELRRSIVAQILSLKQLAEAEGGLLKHVKPHGALYHDVLNNEEIAGVLIEALLEFEDSLSLYVPPRSVISEMAHGHLELTYEAFADRRYAFVNKLIPRTENNALIVDEEEIFQHLVSLFLDKEIPCLSGERISCHIDTFCIHSDTPNSVEILKYLHRQFATRNVKIAFT